MATDNNKVRRREGKGGKGACSNATSGRKGQDLLKKNRRRVTCVTREPSRCYPRLDLEWMVEGGWLYRCLHHRKWLFEAGGSLDVAEGARTIDDGEPKTSSPEN